MWFGSFVSTILTDAENQLNTVIHFVADSDERAHYRSVQISQDGRQEHRRGAEGGRLGGGGGGGVDCINSMLSYCTSWGVCAIVFLLVTSHSGLEMVLNVVHIVSSVQFKVASMR